MRRAGLLNSAKRIRGLTAVILIGLGAGASGNYVHASDAPGAPVRAQLPPAAMTGPALNITNLQEFAQELHLDTLYARGSGARPIRIAILDNGFAGYSSILGKLLPSNTQFHNGPVDAPTPNDPHGTVMAEIVYRLMTDSGAHPEFTPELHLYDSRGYSNFKAAVEDCISRRMDLILYAQVWEYGGNDDGRGFINSVVNEATGAGITWVNASGDFGETTFQSMIIDARDSWVNLPGPNESVEIRCKQNPAGICPLRLVLSWNSFKNDINEGTDKDLDLILTDDTLNIVKSSQLIQKLKDDHQPGTTLYPREIIMTLLKPGTYYARVKDRSHNFGSADRLRLTASGDFISMPQHTLGETLLPPSDNPTVITVGASDTHRTGVAPDLGKPEIEVPSLMHLQSGLTFDGTSSAAAVVTAGIGLLKSLEPPNFSFDSRARLIQAFRKLIQGSAPGETPPPPGDATAAHAPAGSSPPSSDGSGLPLSLLNFGPTGSGGCFVPVAGQSLPGYLQPWIQRGGIPVQTTAGIKVFFPKDPLLLDGSIHRISSDDIVAMGPRGLALYSRTRLNDLPPGSYELLEFPAGQRICQ